MQTSRRYEARAQLGLTLVELLLALSILSLGALISASAINARSPRLVVDQAAEQVVTDLKRARLHAQETGEKVSVAPHDNGYVISKLDLKRLLRSDLDVQWSSNSIEGIVFAERFANPGGRIEISKSGRKAIILIHAITGKIERVE